VGKQRRSVCFTCGWPRDDAGVCYPKPFDIPRKLTNEEAEEVVLPRLGKFVGREGQKSWGDGKPHFPKVWTLADGVVNRYLASVGATGCCTQWDPCLRHRGALRGRDWKTGEYYL